MLCRLSLLLLICAFLFGFGEGGRIGAAPPNLEIVIPSDHDFSTRQSQRRFGGHTDPGAVVTLNNEPLSVFPTGAFAGLFHLLIGTNVYTFKAVKDGETATRTIRIQRLAAADSLPKGAKQFGAPTTLIPKEDVLARVGDGVRVQCVAGAGLSVVYRVGSRSIYYPTVEISPGVYAGEFEIMPDDAYLEASVSFYFGRIDGQVSGAKAMAPGRISVMRARSPYVLAVKKAGAALYVDPTSSARIGNAAPGTRLRATGQQNGRWRVALSSRRSAWIRAADVQEKGVTALAPKPIIRSASILPDGPGAVLVLGCSAPTPVSADVSPDQRTLTVRLYGVSDDLNWIRAMEPTFLERVDPIREEDDVLTARAILKEPLWGYDVSHANGELRIRVRPAPSSGTDGDMAGLHIWLDPGHGGASDGARGATGLTEREANLRLALALEKRLQDLGATVSLGRRTDKAVSLEDRTEEAMENNADLFLSLHCNAVADTTDPLSVRGPSVHYYHGLSQWLAESLTASLAADLTSLEIPNYGLVRNNLFVTRQSTWFPSALVEFCFISHPGDEGLLVSDAGIDRLTQSVLNGIRQGLNKRHAKTGGN